MLVLCRKQLKYWTDIFPGEACGNFSTGPHHSFLYQDTTSPEHVLLINNVTVCLQNPPSTEKGHVGLNNGDKSVQSEYQAAAFWVWHTLAMSPRHHFICQFMCWSETLWTHPLDVLAEGLAEAGAEDLKLDVRVGAAVLKIHRTCQTRDVALKKEREDHL